MVRAFFAKCINVVISRRKVRCGKCNAWIGLIASADASPLEVLLKNVREGTFFPSLHYRRKMVVNEQTPSQIVFMRFYEGVDAEFEVLSYEGRRSSNDKIVEFTERYVRGQPAPRLNKLRSLDERIAVTNGFVTSPFKVYHCSSTSDNSSSPVIPVSQETVPLTSSDIQEPQSTASQAIFEPQPTVSQTVFEPQPSTFQTLFEPQPSTSQTVFELQPSTSQTVFDPQSSVSQIVYEPRPFTSQAVIKPQPYTSQVASDSVSEHGNDSLTRYALLMGGTKMRIVSDHSNNVPSSSQGREGETDGTDLNRSDHFNETNGNFLVNFG